MKSKFLENLIRKFAIVCLIGLTSTCVATWSQAQQLSPQNEPSKGGTLVPAPTAARQTTAALPPVLASNEVNVRSQSRPLIGPVATTSLPAIASAASSKTRNGQKVQEGPGTLPYQIVPAPLPAKLPPQIVTVPPIIVAPVSATVVEESASPPPIVKASLLPVVAATTPPVVPAFSPPVVSAVTPPIDSAAVPAGLPSQLPPIVSPPVMASYENASQSFELMPEPAAPAPIAEAAVEVRGRNFPQEGSELIANWMKNQASDSIDSASFVTPSAPAANTASPEVAGAGFMYPQSDSPSDIPQPLHVSHSSPQEVMPPEGENFVPAPGFGPGPSSVASESYPMTQSEPVHGNYFNNPPVQQPYPGEWDYSAPDGGCMEDTFSCCGFIVESSGYVVADALYWNRSDGVFRASNIGRIDNFDFAPGGRITVGRRRDCTRGWEASYMQFDPWLSVNNHFTASGTLFGAVFPSAGGLAPAAFTAFRDGTFMEQFHKTDLNAAEVNKTYWGADVAKAFIGLRYIHFDDEFRLAAANRFGERGLHRIDATNNMIGLHVGGEMLYDIGYRLSFSVSGKLGGYANFMRGAVGHLNDGTTYINASRADTEFSSSGEIGAFARLKLGPRSRLRIGYELMALWNVIDVESNFSTVVLPSAGQTLFDGDAFFHGVTAGFEVFR
jgi:hypothetical protein